MSFRVLGKFTEQSAIAYVYPINRHNKRQHGNYFGSQKLRKSLYSISYILNADIIREYLCIFV